MQPTTETVLSEAGFKRPPPPRFIKPDPRGTDYGFFEVEFRSDSNFVGYLVRHTIDRYTMQFTTDNDFRNWAKACT